MYPSEGVLFALLSAIAWSFSIVTIRIALVRIQPIEGNLITGILGIHILVFYSALNGEISKILTLNSEFIVISALGGVAGFTLARSFFLHSVKLIGAARAGPLASTSTLFAIFMGIPLLSEGLTPPLLLAGLLITLGISMIATSNNHDGRSSSFTKNILLKGTVLGLAGSLAGGMRFVLAKAAVTLNPAPVIATIIATIFGIVTLLPIFFATKKSGSSSVFDKRSTSYLVISAVASAFAALYTFEALSRSAVAVAVPIVNADPLFTLLASHLFLRKVEHLNARAVLGSLFTVIGVALAASNSP